MQLLSQVKFTLLLSALTLLNIVRLLTVNSLEDTTLLNIFGGVFLLAATLSLCTEHRWRAGALLLGVPAIGLLVTKSLFSGSVQQVIFIASHLAIMLFLIFTIVVILRELLTKGSSVTRDSIAGAFCGYLLIGGTFAEGFCMVETFIPNSFQATNVVAGWAENPLQRWLVLEYFSFTTLTTLGFGDVVPISFIARGLAVWEAICGQFYIAVLVAGLVNLRAARSTSE